jgi:hypothetical protein
MDTCENAVAMVTELENYLLCSVTKSPCNFQRYCIAREEAINTEGSKNCKARVKKEDKLFDMESDVAMVQSEQNQDNAEKDFFVAKDNSKEDIDKPKEFGTVTLVTKSYVVYDYDGNSCFRQGSFNLKIGDKIEV